MENPKKYPKLETNEARFVNSKIFYIITLVALAISNLLYGQETKNNDINAPRIIFTRKSKLKSLISEEQKELFGLFSTWSIEKILPQIRDKYGIDIKLPLGFTESMRTSILLTIYKEIAKYGLKFDPMLTIYYTDDPSVCASPADSNDTFGEAFYGKAIYIDHCVHQRNNIDDVRDTIHHEIGHIIHQRSPRIFEKMWNIQLKFNDISIGLCDSFAITFANVMLCNDKKNTPKINRKIKKIMQKMNPRMNQKYFNNLCKRPPKN